MALGRPRSARARGVEQLVVCADRAVLRMTITAEVGVLATANDGRSEGIGQLLARADGASYEATPRGRQPRGRGLMAMTVTQADRVTRA